MKWAWMVVLPWMAAGVAHGEPGTYGEARPQVYERDWTITAYWENDGGILKRNQVEDRHYTNGLALTAAGRHRVADRIAEHVPLGGDMDRAAIGVVIGQLMFTPEDISRTDLIEDDRPYAGYLYGGVYWQRASASTLDHVELNLGVIGPASQAQALQDSVHDAVAGPTPLGWAHQLDDEAQVQMYVRRKWRVDLNPVEIGSSRIQAQFIPQAGVALGTVYRHVEAAATLRMGWRLPDDFGPGRIDDLPSAVGDALPGWYGYGYVRAGGRLVAHNVFLAGNNFEDSHGVDEEPWVGSLTAGAALGYRGRRWSGQVGYAQTVLSEEFQGQLGTDQYALLHISITGLF